MDARVLQIVGAIAGIGGIALAVLLLIYREVIRREIFPQLTNRQAHSLLDRIVVLTFAIGALGIFAYVIINLLNRGHDRFPDGSPTTTPTPIVVQLSGIVVDDAGPLQGATVTLDEIPGMKPVETSSDGVFTISNIPKGYGEVVRIRVLKKGYGPSPFTEDVVLGKSPPRVKLVKEK